MFFKRNIGSFQAWFSLHQIQGSDFTRITISASDAEFLAVIVNHWIDAKFSRDNSKVESCKKLLDAFCEKFVMEGVFHE